MLGRLRLDHPSKAVKSDIGDPVKLELQIRDAKFRTPPQITLTPHTSTSLGVPKTTIKFSDSQVGLPDSEELLPSQLWFITVAGHGERPAEGRGGSRAQERLGGSLQVPSRCGNTCAAHTSPSNHVWQPGTLPQGLVSRVFTGVSHIDSADHVHG